MKVNYSNEYRFIFFTNIEVKSDIYHLYILHLAWITVVEGLYYFYMQTSFFPIFFAKLLFYLFGFKNFGHWENNNYLIFYI